MHRIIDISFFFFLSLLFSCHDETIIKEGLRKYSVQEAIANFEGKKFDYTMSFDGQYFFAYDGEKLIQYDLINKKTNISEAYVLPKNSGFDLINSYDGIGILSYDKSSQFDTTKSRVVKLYEINDFLKLVDSISFYTEKRYHLLDEDFNYVSYAKGKDGIYFNNKMSYLKIIRKDKWSSEDNSYSNVDLISKVIYKVTIEKDSIQYLKIESLHNDPIEIKSENEKPNHLSIVNGSIIFYSSSGDLLHIRKAGTREFYTQIKINPSNRILGGIYQLNTMSNDLEVFYFDEE